MSVVSYRKYTINGILGILSINNSNEENECLRFCFGVFRLHSSSAWAGVNERFVSRRPTTTRRSVEIFPLARTKMCLLVQRIPPINPLFAIGR